MPLKSTKPKSSAPSSGHKAHSIPKVKPLAASRPAQLYVVIDTTLPSHIINDRSLFTSYMPGRKVHCTTFGHNIIIEGIGDAYIRVFAAGQFILFRMWNCWHVPSSPHHFLSVYSIDIHCVPWSESITFTCRVSSLRSCQQIRFWLPKINRSREWRR